MGFFSGKTKKITTGGELIRGIKKEGEALRPLIAQAIEAAKDPFQEYDVDQRFARLTPEEIEALDIQRDISREAPAGFQDRLDDLVALRELAATGISADDVAARRKLLEPMTQAQTQAAQRGLQQALKTIGVGAGAGGVGALTGGRADVLRSGAAVDFAQTLADIEGQAQERALGMTESDLARRLGVGSQLIGQELGLERDIYSRRLGATDLLSRVGQRQREMDQQRRDFLYGESLREDQAPFLAAQQATTAVGGLAGLMTPQQTKVIRKKSGFSKLAGVGLMAAGLGVGGMFAGNPLLGKAAIQAGAGMASDSKTGGSIGRAPGGNMVGGRKSFLQKLMEKTGTSLGSTGDILDDKKDADKKDDKKKSRKAATITAGAKLLGGEDEILDMGKAELTPAQVAARRRYMYQTGGGIAALATGRSINQIQADIAALAPRIANLTAEEQEELDDLADELEAAQAVAINTGDDSNAENTGDEDNIFERSLKSAKRGISSLYRTAKERASQIPSQTYFDYGLGFLTSTEDPDKSSLENIGASILQGRKLQMARQKADTESLKAAATARAARAGKGLLSAESNELYKRAASKFGFSIDKDGNIVAPDGQAFDAKVQNAIMKTYSEGITAARYARALGMDPLDAGVKAIIDSKITIDEDPIVGNSGTPIIDQIPSR